jgi:glycosyltransferase involved in cell wall biosynthesis
MDPEGMRRSGMRVVFCIYDFVDEKLRLQPWLTVRRVAEGLSLRGHSVCVLTDTGNPARVDGIEVQAVASLRGSNSSEVRARLVRLQPNALVFLPTPLNIVTASWLDGMTCRCIGYASYPFYNTYELARAVRCLAWSEVRQYLRHLLVPRSLWLRYMHRRLHTLVAQSATSGKRLENLLEGKPPTRCIPPGIDLSDWPCSSGERRAGRSVVKLLYLGAASRIRGFDLALRAIVLADDHRIHLKVLARGADPSVVAGIRADVHRYGLDGRVEVEGDLVDRQRLVSEIQEADAVLQPFILVPSELPVTAMEVIACGTPVIGSAIDGLPSTIGPAGTIIKQGSADALAKAIKCLANDASVLVQWREGCRQQRSAMYGWDAVTDQWESLLRG